MVMVMMVVTAVVVVAVLPSFCCIILRGRVELRILLLCLLATF